MLAEQLLLSIFIFIISLEDFHVSLPLDIELDSTPTSFHSDNDGAVFCDEQRERSLLMSCFIFNLIATEDKAQIQTFPHIEEEPSLFSVNVVCAKPIMVGEGEK